MPNSTATAPEERRTENVQFRASAAEKAIMERAAKMDGKSYTTWIREAALEKAKRKIRRG